MHSKKKIIELFNLTKSQTQKIDNYLKEIQIYNSHTNIVGRSTMDNAWNRHVLDSLQLSKYIKNTNSSVIDLGTGAGIPGLMLSIINYKNVTLIDSSSKKINFINKTIPKLNIKAKTYLQRIESLKNKKYDFLISRALSNLSNLFIYSQIFIKKNTVLVFLKGKNVKDEINNAQKIWSFDCKKHVSLSNKDGRVLVISNLKKI